MDYKKLAADLLSGCEENCADCEYAGESEFECTIAQLASAAIADLLIENQALRNAANGFKSLWKKLEAENDALRRISPSAAMTAEESDLRQRLAVAEDDNKRLREAMKPNCLLCDSMHENGNCTEAGGFCTAVPAAHCPLIPKLRARAETAESELEQRKVYYAQMVDALAAVDSKELKETKEKLNAAEARCKRLDEARENANEAAAKWEGMYHMAEARAKMEKWKQAVKIAGAVKDVGAERVAELAEADLDVLMKSTKD